MMPMDKSRYPTDWDAISKAIKEQVDAGQGEGVYPKMIKQMTDQQLHDFRHRLATMRGQGSQPTPERSSIRNVPFPVDLGIRYHIYNLLCEEGRGLSRVEIAKSLNRPNSTFLYEVLEEMVANHHLRHEVTVCQNNGVQKHLYEVAR